MFKLVIIGTIAVVAMAHPISHEMTEKINSKATTWKAADPATNPLSKYTHEELLQKLGTFIVPINGVHKRPQVTEVPTEFDARAQWPNFVHKVRDQQQCGSCWAFGASEALSDRFAISSNGKINQVLSPEDMVSCDTQDYGCGGGYMEKAWDYLEQFGIVTDSCFTYTAGGGNAPACASKCGDGEAFTKYKCQKGSIV